MKRRLQQIAVLVAGAVVAAVMVALGWWQADVYQAQGAEAAAERAAQPPVPLETVAQAGAAVRDGYGRSVVARGHYLATQQVLVPVPDTLGAYRVLSALELGDGTVLAVVRGVVRGDLVAVRPPEPPIGTLAQIGLLLPSEAADPEAPTAGQLRSVRIPALAQLWPQPLIDGYLVLSPADAAAQGLAPAAATLSDGPGRFRNGAYAIQWWIFAAFALGLGAKISRDLGVADDLPDRPVVTAP